MREIDFMAVGESHGDAICIRYGDPNIQLSVNVIDGGYSEIGDNIVKHIADIYGTTNVDNVVLTHADDDHARGLITVMESCEVGTLRMNRPWLFVDEFIEYHHGNYTRQGLIDYIKDTHPYLVELESIANAKRIPIEDVFAGSTYGAFTVLQPSKAQYIALLPFLDKTPEVYGERSRTLVETIRDVLARVAERWDVETLQENPPATSESNETSVVQMFSYDNYNALFTGDVGPMGLTHAFNHASSIGLANPPKLFQIPHQGSRRNVTPTVLNAWLGNRTVNEMTVRGSAYCTVGKNKTDHPRKVVMNALKRRGYPVQVGRGVNVLFSDVGRAGYTTIPSEPFWNEVEDYS